MKTVLLVEDDLELRQIMTIGLEAGGFRTYVAGDGQTAVDLFNANLPDLVILDVQLGLESFDGFEVCRQIRKISDIPIIFLTIRGSDIDQLIGIALGADEYLVKPISTRLLCAKADMVLDRRSHKSQNRASIPSSVPVTVGEIVIDPMSRRVTVKNQNVDLTRTEFNLLTVLASSPERVLTRDEITSLVWGDRYGDDAHIDVHMSRLRKKILDMGGPRIGDNVRGIGFRLQ